MKKLLFIILLSFALVSCKDDPRFNPNVSQVNLNVQMQRFDVDFRAMNLSNKNDFDKMHQKYGVFFDDYNDWIMDFGTEFDSSYVTNCQNFLTDTVYAQVYDEVEKQYTHMDAEDKALTLAFKRLHVLFPQDTLPQVYTHVSGFNAPIICEGNILSASLENYLGAQHPFYQKLGVYQYQLIRKNRNRIVPDCMLGWLMTHYPPQIGKNSRLIDNIIYEGKLYFVMQILLKEIPRDVLYAFTPQQLEWCKNNEAMMWIFLAEQKQLFSNDRLTKSKYMDEGPTTSLFPSESPSRAVVWLGAQIVDQFMRNNKDVSLEDLMKMNDSQEFLKRSKFKP